MRAANADVRGILSDMGTAIGIGDYVDCLNSFVASSTHTTLPSSPTASSASLTTAEDVIAELHRRGVVYNVTTLSYQLRIEKISEINRPLS